MRGNRPFGSQRGRARAATARTNPRSPLRLGFEMPDQCGVTKRVREKAIAMALHTHVTAVDVAAYLACPTKAWLLSSGEEAPNPFSRTSAP